MRLTAVFSLACLAACAGRPDPATSRPPAAGAPAADVQELFFSVEDGGLENHFFRRGPIAAHAIVGGEPLRVLIAFPAANVGAALWFKGDAEATMERGLAAAEGPGDLRGVLGLLLTDAPSLELRSALLGSIRTIRAHAGAGPPPELETFEVVPGPPVKLRRETECGDHLSVALEGVNGTEVRVEGGRIVATGGRGGVELQLRALQDHDPLTPIPMDRLLRTSAPRSRELEVLAFLTYREKLLAGSWRFLTYFGRDTLLSVRLLMPVLEPEVVEAGLGSVLERLSPEGDVAHEEAIGEFVAQQNRERGTGDLCRPIYDYTMVDDDFLLAPILAHYLLDTAAGRERAESFLARETSAGLSFADAVAKNLALVLERAAPYAKRPGPAALVPLREGETVGDWRDSQEDLGGLGGGRFSYSVNAVLVPAALEAAARLYRSGLIGGSEAEAARASALAGAWGGAGSHFQVTIPKKEARARVSAYARSRELDPAAALATLDGPVAFPALSLDREGRPIPIMHTDDGFLLLFRDPSPKVLAGVADRILGPFPAGLRTPVGLVVANPAYAPGDALRESFTRRHYHGTVIWSWQHALLAAGLDRQLARDDLPEETKSRLTAARRSLWELIEATGSYRTQELWSWKRDRGALVYAPFEGGLAAGDESNAAQLWSTTYLALER